MKATQIFNNFCKYDENIAKIARLVIKQMGGVSPDSLRELNSVRDASDGYTGFIWYTDTVAFWRRTRRVAIPYMEEEADGIGESSVLSMCKNFNYVKSHNISESEIAKSLYGRMCDAGNDVNNLMAWYCLESVAFRFNDFIYENDIDLNDAE